MVKLLLVEEFVSTLQLYKLFCRLPKASIWVMVYIFKGGTLYPVQMVKPFLFSENVLFRIFHTVHYFLNIKVCGAAAYNFGRDVTIFENSVKQIVPPLKVGSTFCFF